MSKPPNIVFIHTDSMDGRLMGCMGRSAMRGATPNMDALAASGVLFRNAYSNCPMCVPSRSSMWSGLYTHHCEAWNNYKGLAEDAPTFLSRLTDAGYEAKILGKMDILSGRHSSRARVSAWTRTAGIMRPNYRMEPPRVAEGGERTFHKSDWADVAAAAKYLKDASQRKDGKPFFLYLGIRLPHPPFAVSRHYLERIDPMKVEIPPNDECAHPVLEYQRLCKNWEHGFEEGMLRLVRRIYFAMIAEVDEMLGELLASLRDSGLAGSTYVLFSSDHGEMAMEHRQFYKGSPYEPSVRVPLVISGPGCLKGETVDAPVSLVDVHPTFLDIAGLPKPQSLDGTSLMPELSGEKAARPGWALSEYHDTACNAGWFMLREGPWKYIAYVGHRPQLFNVARDEWELDDLSSANPGKIAEMDELLRGIVDYEAVEAKVGRYDRGSFRRWREERTADGSYEDEMGRIFSGYDGVGKEDVLPWTGEDEELIGKWLREAQKA